MNIYIYSIILIIILIIIIIWAIFSIYVFRKNDKEFNEKFNDVKELYKKSEDYFKKATIRLENASDDEKNTIEYKEELKALEEYKNFSAYMEEKYHGKND